MPVDHALLPAHLQGRPDTCKWQRHAAVEHRDSASVCGCIVSMVSAPPTSDTAASWRLCSACLPARRQKSLGSTSSWLQTRSCCRFFLFSRLLAAVTASGCLGLLVRILPCALRKEKLHEYADKALRRRSLPHSGNRWNLLLSNKSAAYGTSVLLYRPILPSTPTRKQRCKALGLLIIWKILPRCT